jgi:RNA polymerase sigma-70 factor, ECF subfamily
MRVGVSIDRSSEVARLVERHAPTWEDFFGRMYPRLMTYAVRRLGTPDDARDAVSETFARLVGSLESLDRPGVTPEGWCFGILHHIVNDVHRGRYRGRRPAPLEPQGAEDPADGVVLAEEHSSMRQAFGRLGARDKDLLELRVVAGLGAEEVARILSMRPGAVRMAQHRALDRLRSLLESGERVT